MSAFDRVIGYKSIKTELMQVCDNVRNKELYASFGAEFPKGTMLYGDPGLGKTLMAKCFIEELRSSYLHYPPRQRRKLNLCFIPISRVVPFICFDRR